MRSWKLTKYIPDFGWDPIVLTSETKEKNWHCPLPDCQTHYIQNKLFLEKAVFLTKSKLFRETQLPLSIDSLSVESKEKTPLRNVALKIKKTLEECFAFPDHMLQWQRKAFFHGKEIIKKEKPLLIMSTASPFSSHLIASKLSKEFGIPWVADYRDLWTQRDIYNHTHIRHFFEQKLEQKTLQQASAITIVSEPLAKTLEDFLNKGVSVITNGFDQEDYSFPIEQSKVFSIVYTGKFHKIKQDPSPLFEAISCLLREGGILKEKIELHFWGTDPRTLPLENLSQDVIDVTTFHPKVPINRSIAEQKKATILLYANWNNCSEKGVYSGKIFEYLGARRPILSIFRNPDSVVDKLLEETKAGVTLSSSEEIQKALKEWYDSFYSKGEIPYYGVEEKIAQYTRRRQAEQFSEIFNKLTL